MGIETKQKYINIRFIYSIIALFFLFIGYNAIHRLAIKADLPFEYTASENKIIIQSTSLEGVMIESIDGLNIGSIFKMELYLDSKSIGSNVNLGLYSNAKNVNTEIDLVPYYKDNLFIIISTLVGLFFWLTAIFVIFKKPNLNEAKILFWILILFALATVTSPGKYGQSNDFMGVFVRISHGISYYLGISTFLHFIITFPKVIEKKKVFLAFIYIPSVILCLALTVSIYESLTLLSLKWINIYEELWDVLEIFLTVSIILGTSYLFIRYRKFTLKEEKEKILWILWGNVVGVLPFILLYVIPHLFDLKRLFNEDYLLAFLIFIPISFSFAVVKYHIFDIDLVIKNSLLYSMLTALVMVIYFGIVGIVVYLSKGLIGETDKFLSMIVIFFIVAIFNPLRLKVNDLINKTFFRVKYDFERDINIFSSGLKNAGTMKEQCELIINQVEKLIFIKNVAIALRTGSGERLRIPAQKNFDEMTKNVSALRIFQVKSDFRFPLGLPEKVDRDVAIDDIMARVLKKWEISIVIPLEIEKGVVIGALILGDKLSGQKYSKKDIEILNIIAIQSGLAISRLQLQEKIVQEELENEKLEELNNLKSEFVSSVSHELQTPLTSIQIFAETLSTGKVKTQEKQKEYLRIIQGESERLTRLISEILNFSKMEKGIREYHFEKINLISLIRFVVYSLEYQSSKQNIEINFIPPIEDIVIVGDADAVSEAILNLLSNALKYSGMSKNVDVKLYREGDFVFVKIRDYGIGISRDEKELIFNNYYRSKDEFARNSAGTGLGLSITKNIMAAHKGDIEVKSELRKGSEFILKFPISLERKKNE